MQDARGLKWLKPPETRGYIPADQEAESVSKTLEYAFDDWCIAQLAAKLERAGRPPVLRGARRLLQERVRPVDRVHAPAPGRRLVEGAVLAARTRSSEQHDYTEGNAWQYTWSVMHDVRGLMTLMGGPERLRAQARRAVRPAVGHRGRERAARHLGADRPVRPRQRAEPPHRLSLRVRRRAVEDGGARATRSRPACTATGPDGLCGNEDCGQMSAWYLFSAMGFYPVNPADGVYVIGAPHRREGDHRPGRRSARSSSRPRTCRR